MRCEIGSEVYIKDASMMIEGADRGEKMLVTNDDDDDVD